MATEDAYSEVEAQPGAGAEPAPIDQGSATPNNWDPSDPEEVDLTYASDVFEYLESDDRFTRDDSEAPMVYGGDLEAAADYALDPVDEREFGDEGYAEPGFNPDGGSAPAIINKEEEVK